MSSNITFSEAELEAIETLAGYALEPGTRCPLCHRRHNKPRKTTSPDARKIDGGRLPLERAELVDEAIDSLQEYVGADKDSFARGTFTERLVAFGIQHREELRADYEATYGEGQ